MESRWFAPRLQFPVFQDQAGWSFLNGDLLFDTVDRRPAQRGLPILAISQEHGAVSRDEINYHVSVTDASVATYKEVRPGDFIISLRSFQGGIEYSRVHGICSPAYIILRRKGSGLDEFYRHLFKSPRFILQSIRNIEGLRDGKMISYRQFSELSLPVPESAEQQKIAECLTSLDELINAQARKLEALRKFKHGLMENLFPSEGSDTPPPPLRFPEFRDAPNWLERRAGTLFMNRCDPGVEGLPVYSVTMNDGMVKRSTLDRKFDDIAKPSGNKRVQRGDIAYNMMRMWQGACGVAPEDCMVSPAYIVLAPEEDADSPFFAYYFKRPQSLNLLTSHSRGLTEDRLRLYYADFAQMRIRVPQRREQKRVAEFLSSLDALISVQNQRLSSLRIHKQGLMQSLFPSQDETLPADLETIPTAP